MPVLTPSEKLCQPQIMKTGTVIRSMTDSP